MTMNKKRKWLPLKIISIVLFLAVAVLLLWNALVEPFPWAVDALQKKAAEYATQEAINTARHLGGEEKPYLKDIDYTKLTLGSCYVGTKAETQNSFTWEIRYREELVGYVMQNFDTLRLPALIGDCKSVKLLDLEEVSLDDYKKVKDSSVNLGPFEWKLPLGWVTVDGHKAYRDVYVGLVCDESSYRIAGRFYAFDKNGFLICEVPDPFPLDTKN